MTTSDAQLEERRRAAIREREREAQVLCAVLGRLRIHALASCSVPGF